MNVERNAEREVSQISYNTHVNVAQANLNQARDSGGTLRLAALTALSGLPPAEKRTAMNTLTITSFKDAKTFIATVKKEAGKGKSRSERKAINRALDSCFNDYKTTFEGSLKTAAREIGNAERDSKILDGKSERVSRISSSVKSFFRRQSLAGLQAKVDRLTHHRPIQGQSS